VKNNSTSFPGLRPTIRQAVCKVAGKLIFLGYKGGNQHFLKDKQPKTSEDQKSPGLSQGFDYLWNPQDIDNYFDVIGQKPETHLGAV